jgi:hypothetical protein
VPRPRDQIVGNLEALYREAYGHASAAADAAEMRKLDFGFRRDQLYLEAILDVRDLLGSLPAPAPTGEAKADKSVLEQINDIRRLTTKLPFGL